MRSLFTRMSAVLLLLMVGITSVSAQDTFGLSEEDFLVWISANVASLESAPYQFDVEFEYSMDAPESEETVYISTTGSGSLDLENELFQFSLTGEAQIAGQALPLEAEIRLIGEDLYAQFVDPMTGESSGWITEDLDTVFESLEELGDPDELLTAMDETLSDLDPSAYITGSRDGSTFSFELDLASLLEDAGAAEQLAAMPDAGGVDGATLSEAIAASTITFAQGLSDDESSIEAATLSWFSESGVTVDITLTVTITSYGEAVEVIAPDTE